MAPNECTGSGCTQQSICPPYMKSYLSVPKVYSVKLRVIAVDAGGGGAKSHRGTPSRGLEWAGFEAAPATDPTGRRTVHFAKTLLFITATYV